MKKILLTFMLLGGLFSMTAQTIVNSSYPGIRLTNTNSQIHFWGSGIEKWKIGISGDATNNFIIYDAENAVNRFLIDETTGNIGIGTANPTTKLHVFNGDHSYGAILANSTEAPFSLYTKTLDRIVNTEMFRLGLKYNTDENNGFISFYRGAGTFGGFLGFSTNGLERMKIDTQGNVGIGTATPEFKLDVANGSTAVSQYFRLRDFDTPNDNSALTRMISRDGNSMFWNGGVVMGQYANDAIGDLGEGYLVVQNKIGIGTSNLSQDSAKFLVEGKILCEEVEVIQDVLPDYVFQKYYTGTSALKADYVMPTLEEVEAFTKTNHHLPSVPSAAEVKEEGMQLKEMTTILLQKVEELTLYTIEQEKRIKALEAKLAEKK